jgi:hypothetical protein
MYFCPSKVREKAAKPASTMAHALFHASIHPGRLYKTQINRATAQIENLFLYILYHTRKPQEKQGLFSLPQGNVTIN